MNLSIPVDLFFISYRQSDGFTHAADFAWASRAAGVPVWLDQSDLPPGDTEYRLAEALESGLSGAVLLVTPEIKCSRIVREIELPELLELEKNPAFTLSVMSLIEHTNGELDFDAPDQLLKQAQGTLKRLNQTPARTPSQKADAAHAHCRRRMQAIKEDVKAAGGMITLDVQTRVAPSAAQGDADLILRLRPPTGGERLPHRQGLEDLQLFLAGLPQLLQDAGARHARLSGGAHLSSAYALGAALPTTLFGRTEVIDTEGRVWALNGNAPVPEVLNRLLNVRTVSTDCAPPGEILAYLDLRSPSSNAAFNELVAKNVGRFASVFHVRPDPGRQPQVGGCGSNHWRSLATHTRTGWSVSDHHSASAAAMSLAGCTSPWPHTQHHPCPPVRMGGRPRRLR